MKFYFNSVKDKNCFLILLNYLNTVNYKSRKEQINIEQLLSIFYTYLQYIVKSKAGLPVESIINHYL